MNAAQQVTPLVGRGVAVLLDMGFRDVRNQGVLLRGVNTTPQELLELCFTLLDHGKIMPYYFYMCDMIPNAEHWRTASRRRRRCSTRSSVTCPGSRRRG